MSKKQKNPIPVVGGETPTAEGKKEKPKKESKRAEIKVLAKELVEALDRHDEIDDKVKRRALSCAYYGISDRMAGKTPKFDQ